MAPDEAVRRVVAHVLQAGSHAPSMAPSLRGGEMSTSHDMLRAAIFTPEIYRWWPEAKSKRRHTQTDHSFTQQLPGLVCLMPPQMFIALE